MIFLAKFFLLVWLINLLLKTDLPYLCAFIYSTACLLLMAMFLMPLTSILLSTIAIALLSTVYFWLLNKMQEGILWWLIMMVGFVALTLSPIYLHI